MSLRQRSNATERAEPAPPEAVGPARPNDPSLPDAGGRSFDPSRLSLVLVALLAGASLFLGGYTLGARVSTTPGTPASEEAQFAPFWDTYSLIQHDYAGSPKPSQDQLVQAAIKGMMDSLNDPYSYYQSPEDFANALLDVGGQAVGVGISVQLQPVEANAGPATCDTVGNGCELAIVAPIPGSPAEGAGLRAGDVITAVDGASLDGLNLDQITAKIKGQKGTPVTLAILRGSVTQNVTIVRQVYTRPEVDTKTLANGAVAYIHIAGINDPAYSQFRLALSDALQAGRKSIVIDLRGNGGGFVPDAVYIASQFIGSGTLLYQVDASGTTTEIGTKTPPNEPPLALDPSVKVVVLVDGGTASASEILAGALQVRARATLVGEKTYGKGVVQEWLPLPNNDGGIHLTVARWLLPNKVWIQGIGLTPNVPATNQGARAGTDPVLDAGLVTLGFPPETTASPSPGASASPGPSQSPGSSAGTSATPTANPSATS